VLDPSRATAFRCDKDVVDGGLPLRPHRHQMGAIHPAAEGMPVAWCLADPKLGAREVAADLPAHARDTGALMMTELTRDRAGPRRPWLATLSDRIRLRLAPPWNGSWNECRRRFCAMGAFRASRAASVQLEHS
jgi:hypothetical protein